MTVTGCKAAAFLDSLEIVLIMSVSVISASRLPVTVTGANSAGGTVTAGVISLAMALITSVSVMSPVFLVAISTVFNAAGGVVTAGVVLAAVSIMLVPVMSEVAFPVTSTLFNASVPEAAPASVGGFKASTCEAGNALVSVVPVILSLMSSIVPATLPFD